MFDLPTVEKENQRNANRFRQGLLELGYLMLQESVYARNCVSLEKYQKHLSDVKAIAPSEGLINLFFITNRQWLDSETVICPSIKARRNRKVKAGDEAPQQMTFW
jgi:CRISPR-associated protein Cas2